MLPYPGLLRDRWQFWRNSAIIEGSPNESVYWLGTRTEH